MGHKTVSCPRAVGGGMGAAPGAGWEEGEFEFKLVFEEDPPPQQQQSQGPNPVRTAETTSSMPAEENEGALLQLEPPKSSGGGGGGILGQSHLPDGCTVK